MKAWEKGSRPFFLFEFDERTETSRLVSIGADLSVSQAEKIGNVQPGGESLEVWGYEAVEVCSAGAGSAEVCRKF